MHLLSCIHNISSNFNFPSLSHRCSCLSLSRLSLYPPLLSSPTPSLSSVSCLLLSSPTPSLSSVSCLLLSSPLLLLLFHQSLASSSPLLSYSFSFISLLPPPLTLT